MAWTTNELHELYSRVLTVNKCASQWLVGLVFIQHLLLCFGEAMSLETAHGACVLMRAAWSHAWTGLGSTLQR